MRLHIAFSCATVVALLASPGAQAAQAAKFGLKQIVINGSTNVTINAINDRGVVVGIVDGQGFVADGANVTLLPPLVAGCTYCSVNPTAINARGDVGGVFQIDGVTDAPYESLFLWRNGSYLPSYSVVVPNNNYAQSVAINNRGEIVYTLSNEMGNLPYGGVPPAVSELVLPGVTGTSDIDVLPHCINRFGWVGGEAIVPTRHSTTIAAFAGPSGKAHVLLPPGAIRSSGGFVNDFNQVAGAYDDGKTQHGFVYKYGHYSFFDMPTPISVNSLGAAAINNTGRVVGEYADAVTRKPVVFWYNGSDVSVFTVRNAGTGGIAFAFNNRSELIISYITDATPFGSPVAYRVSCAGAGC